MIGEGEFPLPSRPRQQMGSSFSYRKPLKKIHIIGSVIKVFNERGSERRSGSSQRDHNKRRDTQPPYAIISNETVYNNFKRLTI